jgi:uncharacterized membrane protein
MPPHKTSSPHTEQTTQRIEAFSDGVFAIAITLLILEIKVPHAQPGSPQSLKASLLALWPSYFAYLLSFVMIGIYWANHHYFMRLYRRTNHVFNLLNVFFLMWVSFLPFPTAVLGEYVNHPEEYQTAVTLYAFGLFMPALGWCLLWLYGSRNYLLIDRRLDTAFVQKLTRPYLISVFVYGAAVLIALWNAYVSLGICIGLTMLYLMPPPRPLYVHEETQED